MADILSLSVSGKGLFAFNNGDPLAPQPGQLFAAGEAQNLAANPVVRDDIREQSSAFASFASLFDSQLDQQQAGRVGILPQVSGVQQPSPSLFFSGEPLTSTPTVRFQLSVINGDGLPRSGMHSPASGNPLPASNALAGPQILDPAHAAVVIAGSKPALTLGDMSFTADPGQSQPLAVEEIIGTSSGIIDTDTSIDTAHSPQDASAESIGDIFDDLAFLPEESVSSGDAMAGDVVEAVNTVTSPPQQFAAVPVQAGAAVEVTADIAGADTNEIIAGKAALTGIDETEWRQHGKLAGGGEASEAPRYRESTIGRTERPVPESSRQQFAEQLAQSALAEGEGSNRIGAGREQLSQVTGQAQASAAPQASQAAPEAQQTTRMEPAMTTAEQTKAAVVENKSADIRLPVPFSRKDWSEQLGKQLGFLVSRNLDSAQIQLDPPELGPLQVRIQLHQEQVSLQFHAQHGIVREAVDQSLGRLQELFSEEGLELVSVDVSDGESNRESTGDKQESRNSLAAEQAAEGDEILTPVVSQLNSDGKIDYFI